MLPRWLKMAQRAQASRRRRRRRRRQSAEQIKWFLRQERLKALKSASTNGTDCLENRVILSHRNSPQSSNSISISILSKTTTTTMTTRLTTTTMTTTKTTTTTTTRTFSQMRAANDHCSHKCRLQSATGDVKRMLRMALRTIENASIDAKFRATIASAGKVRGLKNRLGSFIQQTQPHLGSESPTSTIPL